MAIEELAKSATRSTGPTPNPQEEPNFFLDVLASPFRGVEGAIQGIYDLADFATGDDLLPDYNERFLGRSQTFVGGLGEGVTQFLTGFIPVAGVAGRIGALTKVGKAGKKALNLKGYAAAGAVADFSVFQAQEQRLSNLIEAFPSLSNPVSEFLAADEDDGEIEGRFKNTIEGLGIGGLADSLLMGVKFIKRKRAGEADEDILKDVKFDRYRDNELLREDFETTDDFRGLIDQAFTRAFGKGIVNDGTEVTAFEAAKQFNSVYNGELKPLLEALIENGEQSLGNTTLSFSKRGKDGDFIKGTTFDHELKTIDMQEGGARTFIHELLHATTSTKLNDEFTKLGKELGIEVKDTSLETRVVGANKEALETLAQQKDSNPIAGLADAYLQVIKALEADDAVFGRTDKEVSGAEIDSMTAYGLTNMDEFITEAFTNPEFRRVLMAIPSTNQASKTMFDQFMDVIKKMLGVNGNQASLLDDVFKYTDNVVRDQDAMFDGGFDYLKSIDDLNNRTMGQRELPTLGGKLRRFEGGFDPRGKGTREGDGKDQAMRDVADSAIVEIQEGRTKPSSSQTSLDRLGAPTEDSSIIMLARNGTLRGKELRGETKVAIKNAHDNGAEFVVGDMSGVDSQFIDWLDELGADYTIYHTGDRPRIGREVGEMKVDKTQTPERGRSMGKFSYPVRGNFFGKDLSEIPTNVLKAAMRYNNKALTAGVKNRIQAELNAIEAGYAPYVSFENVTKADVKVTSKMITKAKSIVRKLEKELKDENLTPAKRKTLEGKLDEARQNLIEVQGPVKGKSKASENRVDIVTVKGSVAGVRQAEKAGEGVSVLRKAGEKHYGNPFSHLKTQTRDTVKTKDLQETVSNYKAWLEGTDFTDVKQERRKWILDQIDSGALDGKQLLYHSNQQPNHAGVLAAFIKQRRPNTTIEADPSRVGTAESYLRDVASGGKTPKEEYARYLRNRGGVGGKAENNTMRLKEYTETQRILRGEPTTGKIRIQGKSQRSSDLQRQAKGMPDSITEARERGRYFSSEYSSTMGQRQLKEDELKTIQKLKGDLTELIVNGDVAEDIGPDAFIFRAGNPFGAPRVEAEKGKDYEKYVKLKEKISKLEEEYTSKYGDSSATMGQRQLDQNIEESIARMANDLETGGDGAIANFARGIRNTTQAVALVQAIAKNLEKAPTAKPVSAEELIAENADVIDTLGGNAGDYAATIGRLTDQIDLSNYRNVQTAVYKLIDVMTADVVDLANQADEALINPKLNKQQLEVQLLSTLDQMQEVGRIWSLMGREAGLTLVQRKFLLDPSGKYRIKSGIGFDSKTATPQEYDKFLNENRAGTMPVEKMVQILKGSKDKAQAKANIKKAMNTAEETFGSKAMDVTMEVWMNSLLSGPTTQVVNLLGNSLTLAIRAIEQSVGSVLIRDPQLARATLKYAFDMESVLDVLKIAGKTFMTGESRLVQGSKAFEDRQVTRRAIAKDGDGTLATAINMLGTVINIPSRALAFGDEFFKQMNYRSYVKTNLAYEAMKKGAKTGPEIAEYVTKNFDNFITKGARAYNEKGIYMDAVEAAQAQGLKFGKEQEEFIAQYLKDNPFDETRGGLADAARGFAEETTFTNDLKSEGVIGTLSNTLNTLKNKGGAWRTLNFVIPFLRTPTNILKFSIDRTPLGTVGMVATKAKRAELTKQLTSEDPTVRAQLIGKLTVSTAATAAILYYMNTNKVMITGGGPPNRDELEALRMSGWRPYSIKIGDTYYSYQRADPIATILGLFADIIEGQQYHDVEDIVSQDMVALGIMSLTQNVTNKSYVKGLDTLLQLVRDPVGNFKPFAGNIVGGFAPTFLTQVQNMADERELKETRTIFDYWLKKVPIAQATLPSRRNFLGEVIKNQNSPYMTGVLNPIYFNKESKDLVDKELAGLQHGFSQPSTKLYNAIEMRDVYNAEGRQAFDRYLELSGTTKIGGKTMRQSLRQMVKDKGYQALPKESDDDLGELSPRIKAVQRLVRAYRRKARYEMLEEFPELKDSIYQLQQDKAQYRLIQ